MPSGADRGNRHALPLLIGGLVIGLVARLSFAFHDDGLLWPDEYYQSLEPAHRAVFGYGWQAWEFLEGARHWTLPGFVAAVMRLSTALGVDYLAAIEVTFCVVGAGTVLAIHQLARVQGASPLASAIAATSFALMGLAVYVAPRAMGESLSALPITVAFTLLFREGRARLIFSAVLLTLAVGLRLQNGLFCLGALGLLLMNRRRADAALLFGLLAVGALVYGAVDHFTWGAFFHSARQYLLFNLIEGRASQFGTAPFLYYVGAIVTAEGLTLIPLIALTTLGARTRPEVPLIALGFFLAHSVIPHKELRFLFPIIPLLCAQAALGLDRLAEHRERAAMGVLVLSVASLATLPTLTFWRLGIWNPKGSAIDFGGPENRLLRRASTLSDLCGLKIASLENWRTGGYAYLHQRVPMYRFQPPEAGAGHYNYVIAQRGQVTGTEVAVESDRALIKLSESCTPDLTYDWHLE
jgi:GPI mannosyltransferase 3